MGKYYQNVTYQEKITIYSNKTIEKLYWPLNRLEKKVKSVWHL